MIWTETTAPKWWFASQRHGPAGNLTVTTNNNVAQFLSILDGLTGVERARALLPNPYFADGPLNCHAGIAYFDGIHPSIVFSGENRVGTGPFQRLSWRGTSATGS
jgi:hypothetical protein